MFLRWLTIWPFVHGRRFGISITFFNSFATHAAENRRIRVNSSLVDETLGAKPTDRICLVSRKDARLRIFVFLGLAPIPLMLRELCNG